MQKKVIITGATGLLGKELIKVLEKEYDVYILTRQKFENERYIHWDIHKKTVDSQKLENTYALIHLAGASVVDKRWSSSRKKEIISSRVDSIGLLYEKYKEMGHFPEVVISASGIGYYGSDTGNTILTEEGENGKDFIAEVTKKWEEASRPFAKSGSRLVHLRIGIVLSNKGGALPKMSLPIKYGLGSPLASGKQLISWIHIHDLCHLFHQAISSPDYKGAYNAVADDVVTNKEFMKSIASSLNRRIIMPNVPSFVLKLLLGEMSELLIGGNNVSNQKLKKIGFQFEFSKLSEALKNLNEKT